MASLAQSLPASSGQSWLWQWLKDELSPYPGRALLVARMVAAATLVMLITMTFRVPYGAYAALFAFNVSRESLHSTTRTVRNIVVGFVSAGAFALVGATLVIADPLMKFVWIVATLFLAFYVLSASGNSEVWMRFGYMVVITVPLWDRRITAQAKVDQLLWAVGALTLASVIALLLEIGYAALVRGADLIDPLTERLGSVEELLRRYANNGLIDATTQSAVTRLAMLGTSRLRGLLHGSDKGAHYAQQMGAVVALTGRLVDLAANLPQLVGHVSDADRARIGGLANRIAAIRHSLKQGLAPGVAPPGDAAEAWPRLPLLGEIEKTVALIPEAFAGSESLRILDTAPQDTGGAAVLAPFRRLRDEDLKFALKGCLAASLCYIIYSGLDWPEISTSVTTCFITALTTIGSSRQKQVLRIGGAIIGGFVIGIGAQVFILPYFDTISAFTVLFLVVSAAAAWITTSSPRLSYLGLQAAFAFYLINLQEFKLQTSLTVARDRVVGILLGLSVMWLVFDRLWSAPAGVEMRKTFAASFRLLAEFAREPVSTDLRTAIQRSDSLRETINAHFDKVRSLADGILFEFGPSRRINLEFREHIRQWQPQLRTLFVMRIASWKYRAQVPGFEVPDGVRLRHKAYDHVSARILEEMAGRIEKPVSGIEAKAEDLHQLLNQSLHDADAEAFQALPLAKAESFVALVHGIDALTNSLATDIASP